MSQISFDILSFNTRSVELRNQLGDKTYTGKIANSPAVYAIKVSNSGYRFDLHSFFGDVKDLTDLWSPSLVPVTYASFSKENKKFYIVSKYFANGSLQQHLEPKISHQFTPTFAAITVLGLAHALQKIHGRGGAHGKISPSKILYDDKMYPHLIDTWLSEGPQDIRFVAPELMAHRKADERAADIFSFALIYYYCVCGCSPFEGIYQMQIGPYFFSGQRPPIPENITPFSRRIITQCWDQDPRQRPSADQLYRDLQEHYNEIMFSASIPDVTKYSKMLTKYPFRCFYSKMGDSESCIKMAQMLREYDANEASQMYMQIARSSTNSGQMPDNRQFMPMGMQQGYGMQPPQMQDMQPPMQEMSPFMQQQQQQNYGMQQSFVMQPPIQQMQPPMQQIPPQTQPQPQQPFILPGQPTTVIIQGKPVMMQPMMMNGQIVMQPIEMQMDNMSQVAPAPVQKTSSGKKKSGQKKSRQLERQRAAVDLEEERYRMEAERIRQENKRIKAENERLQMSRLIAERQQEIERNRIENDSITSTLRARKEIKQYEDDEDSREFNFAKPKNSFTDIPQVDAFQSKPSVHRREELAQSKKAKSKSQKKPKKVHSTTDSIFEAAEKGDVGELQRYIEQEGLSANEHDTFRSTPLHLACENGHEQAVKYLISKGANINKCDKWHKTPLHWASQGGFTSIAKILLDNNADTGIADKWGSIPLQLAAEKDHVDTVSLLVKAGSPVEHQDNSGKTAMGLSKNEEIRAILQSVGAQPRVCFVLS